MKKELLPNSIHNSYSSPTAMKFSSLHTSLHPLHPLTPAFHDLQYQSCFIYCHTESYARAHAHTQRNQSNSAGIPLKTSSIFQLQKSHISILACLLKQESTLLSYRKKRTCCFWLIVLYPHFSFCINYCETGSKDMLKVILPSNRKTQTQMAEC